VARSHAQLPDRRGFGRSAAVAHASHALLPDDHLEAADPAVAHVDLAIRAVAQRQHGVIGTKQLVAAGLGRGAIADRVRRGLLAPAHRGVYLWGTAVASLQAQAFAAAQACGVTAVVSHHAAAALHGIRDDFRGPIDVTIPARRARVDGVRTHQPSHLAPADVDLVEGIRVTAPHRALLEFAPEMSPRELDIALERAQVQRLVTKPQLEAALARAPGHPGTVALRALVEDARFTRSHAERRLVALLRSAKLPEPLFNARVGSWEVDALWERQRVVLEFDSYGFHATRAAFERDRRKTADLTRSRYTVLRTTWLELTKQSLSLIARIAEALALSCRASTS
jgi:very-short-patch-repair endonuclease